MRALVLMAAYFFFCAAHAVTNSIVSEEKDFDVVVLLQNKGLDDQGDVINGYCVGTFISTNTVVTAAHCVAQAEALSQRETKIQFGAYKYVVNSKGEKVRVGYRVVQELITVPQFRFTASVAEKIKRQGTRVQIQPGEDIAYITLTSPVDLQSLGLVPMPTVTSAELAGMKSNFLNYWPTIVSVNPLSELAMRSVDIKQKAQLTNLNISGTNLESRSSARVEPGDSGSPLFVRIGTQWKLLAVTKGMAKSFFDDWDMFTLVFM